MGFGDLLGDAFDAAGDAAGDTLGVVMDTAKAAYTTGTTTNYGERHRAGAELGSEINARRRQFLTDHRTLAALSRGVGDTVEGGLSAINWAISHGVTRPLSTYSQHEGSLSPFALVPGVTTGDHPSWSQAWKQSGKTSVGQSEIVNWNRNTGNSIDGFPTDYKNAWRYGTQGDAKFNAKFSLASGALDAVVAWYAVPPVKSINAARAFESGDVAAIAGDVAKMSRRQKRAVKGVNDLVTGSDGKTAFELAQVKTFRDSTNGTALASLFAQASGDHATKRLILRSALGDTAAHQQLAAQRADIAGQIDRMTEDLDNKIWLERDALDLNGSKFAALNNQADKEALKTQLRASHEVLDMLDRAVGNTDKAAEVAKSRALGFGRDDAGVFGAAANDFPGLTKNDLKRMKGASSYTIQTGVAGIPVRVLRAPLNYRPAGVIDLHNGDQGLRELDAMTKRPGVAGLDPELRAKLLDNFINAQDDNARMLSVRHTEAVLVNHIGKQLGYAPEDVQPLLKKMMNEREAAVPGYKGERYTSAVNPASGDYWDVRMLDDGTAMVRPIMETQLDNTLSTLDVDHIHNVLKRNKSAYTALKFAGEKFDILKEAGDLFNDLWKFQALFRGGYIMRNAVDTNLRLLAFLGAQDYGRITAESIGQSFNRAMSKPAANAEHQVAVDRLAAAKASLKGTKGTERASLKREIEDLTAKVDNGPQPEPALGQGRFNAGGAYNNVVDARGVTEGELLFHNKELSASDSWANFIVGESNKRIDRYRGSGDWRTVTGYDPMYSQHYLRATNQHIRQSEIAMRLLKGEDPDRVVAWLKSNKGRHLRRRMVYGSDSAEELVAANMANIEHLIPNREMWKTLSEREFRNEDINSLFGKLERDRPDVNAEQVSYSLGQHPVAKEYAKIRDGYFEWVSKMTDDAMGRHPLYTALYRGQYRKLLNHADPGLKGTLTEAEQRILEEQSRLFARREMRRVMFDVSQKTDLAHFVRFVMPFYAAWQDAIVKYGRLIARDPALLVRGAALWTAPNDSSFVEVVDAQTGKPIPGNKSRLTDNEVIRIPQKWAKKLGIDYTLDISKASLNIALQGDPIWAPGWGPMGQIPANEIVKRTDSPELGDIFQQLGILPFGVQDQGTLSWKALAAGPTRQLAMPDARKARLKAMILMTEEHRYQTGERKTEPTAKEIESRWKALFGLRYATSVLSPFSIQFKSPYQFYIDQSHSYDAGIGTKYKDGSEADKAFYQDFGQDFYIFRTSMSKTNVPIEASNQADKAARRIKDLIGKYPSYAPFLIGPDNKGDYNPNVYTLQSIRKLGISSDRWRDTYSNPAEAIKKNNAELGWIEYRKLSDRLDAIRIQRGLPNMLVKGAADLRQIKSDWIEKVTNPDTAPRWGSDWYDDYNTRDTGYARKFLIAAKEATQDKRLKDRPDMQTMAAYLSAREKIRKILVARKHAGGSGSIFTASNGDLGAIWANITGYLNENDVLFSQIYTRYLEKDDLSQAV